jgi:homoserine dehydrogenase
MAENAPLQIGLAGFGNVGAGVFKNLEKNRDLLQERIGRDLVIRTIAVRDAAKSREVALPSDLVKAALLAGKPVVTGNKALLAERGRELFAIADERDTPIYFEAAVAGGIPIIKTVQESLVGNRIESMAGIINGSCNYILTRMSEAGLSYPEALAEAQKRSSRLTISRRRRRSFYFRRGNSCG